MRIVITGSSSGIGRALTLRLLNQGHIVCGLARSNQKSLAAEFPKQFFAMQCDVADWTQVAAAREEFTKNSTSLDALITCAGIQGAIGRTVTLQPEAWDDTVRTNLNGTFHAIRAFWDDLLNSKRRAKIVCFAGGGATKARSHLSSYGAAKTAIVRLVETIAIEEEGQKIDINSISPGAINTRMTDEIISLGPTVVGRIEYNIALKQKLETEGALSLEKALDLVNWLLSPESDGISGKLISAQWDPWKDLQKYRADLKGDIYTLRRIVPEDRNKKFLP